MITFDATLYEYTYKICYKNVNSHIFTKYILICKNSHVYLIANLIDIFFSWGVKTLYGFLTYGEFVA